MREIYRLQMESEEIGSTDEAYEKFDKLRMKVGGTGVDSLAL